MNVTGDIGIAQWEEIQRRVQQRAVQRRSVTDSYSSQAQLPSVPHSEPDSMAAQLRTVFTRSGGIEKLSLPKGTLFDRTA